MSAKAREKQAGEIKGGKAADVKVARKPIVKKVLKSRTDGAVKKNVKKKPGKPARKAPAGKTVSSGETGGASEIKTGAAPVFSVKTPETATHPAVMAMPHPAPLRAGALVEDDYELPRQYGETAITLLARDPHWLHLYWEICPRVWQEMRDRFGPALDRARFILRVYDVTYVDFNGFNANHSFDIEVGPFAVNWYINLWSDNTSYCVDLAAILPDGYYHLIARSNCVVTPRASRSHRDDLIWMEVRDHESRGPYVNLNFRRGRGGAAGFGKKRLFLTDDEVRRYYEKYFYLLRQILIGRSMDDFYAQYGQHLRDLQVENIDLVLDDVLDEEDEQSPGPGGVTRRVKIGASEEITRVTREKGARQKRRRPEEFGGASEADFSRPGPQQPRRKFFFEIGTELIVYGRTEPDARVTLGGKPVALDSDGAFSLRFTLGDETIPLDFIAESGNQIDKRRISTSVERSPTDYQSEG
jgi:hypothetical protein